MSTKKLQILGSFGNKVYTQPDEPADAVDGSVWIDLDETAVGDYGDADTLDGKHASDFASATDISIAQSDISDLQIKVGDTAVSTQISSAIANKSDVGHIHDVATETNNGFMSADDKVKLDNYTATTAYSASGAVITLDDSSNGVLQGLRIFGRTTQDGTPSLESPVDLVSLGDSGSINVTVGSNNIYFGGWESGTIGSSSGNNQASNTSIRSVQYIPIAAGNKLYIIRTNSKVMSIRFYDQEKKYIGNGGYGGTTLTAKNYIPPDNASYIKLVISSTDLKYAIFVGYVDSTDMTPGSISQSITVSTPNSLPGIPVTSGGNYTDGGGQQWICDMVDFENGVYVQRIGTIDSYTDEAVSEPYLSTTGELSTGATILYALTTPIETALPDEEITAYTALHTNYPNTTIYNNAGAEMTVEYCTPNTAVPMIHLEADAGKILAIDERGCVIKKAVDNALSSTSTNPVQNKVIDTAISNLNTLVGDTAVSAQISNAIVNKVDKSEIGNAGITNISYTPLFGGQFSVTTVQEDGYIKPHAQASVTGSLSRFRQYRVTINDVQYQLLCGAYFEHDSDGNYIVYNYLGNLSLYSTDTTGLMLSLNDVPFLIKSTLNDSGKIDVFTSEASSASILIEVVNKYGSKLPDELIYGDTYAAPLLHKCYVNNDACKTSIGVNAITASDGIAIGLCNTISGNYAQAFGYGTTASAQNAHAEGYRTVAAGISSHAGGEFSEAGWTASFAHGNYVKTVWPSQFVVGYGNNPQNDSIFEVGNGLKEDGTPDDYGRVEPTTRQNAFRVTQNGVAIAQTGLQIGNTVITETQLQQLLALIG